MFSRRLPSNVAGTSLWCLPSFREYVDMIKSKFPSMEIGIQYEIAELLKSAETKVIKAKSCSQKALSNEKNIMHVQMEMKMEFQKNMTTNYYLKLLSHLTQR